MLHCLRGEWTPLTYDTLLHHTMHYVTLHHITSHFITLYGYISLYYMALYWISLRSVVSRNYLPYRLTTWRGWISTQVIRQRRGTTRQSRTGASTGTHVTCTFQSTAETTPFSATLPTARSFTSSSVDISSYRCARRKRARRLTKSTFRSWPAEETSVRFQSVFRIGRPFLFGIAKLIGYASSSPYLPPRLNSKHHPP